MVEIHNTSMLLMCTLSTMQMFVSINNAHDPIATIWAFLVSISLIKTFVGLGALCVSLQLTARLV